MTDEELAGRLLDQYRASGDLVIDDKEVSLVLSVILLMIKSTRIQPVLPESVDVDKDDFTYLNILVQHQPNGSVKINARSTSSVWKTPDDILVDAEIVKQYLETVTSPLDVPKIKQ